jgi:hypothetical protein
VGNERPMAGCVGYLLCSFAFMTAPRWMIGASYTAWIGPEPLCTNVGVGEG